MTLISHFADVLADSDVPDGSDSGAVSRYEFENDVTDSWGSNDGTDNTSAGFVNGVRGEAKDFDGSGDYVSIPSSTIGTPPEYTLSAWVNLDAPSDGNVDGVLVLREDTGAFIKTDGSGNMTLAQEDGSGGSVSLQTSVGSGWTHFALKWNGSELIAYKNGTQVASGSISTIGVNTTYSDDIGGNSAFDGNYMNGQIDDVRIYDRALTPQEVNNLYKWGQATDYASNNHGQFNGPTETNGPFGNSAMSFDGSDDYIDVPLGNGRSSSTSFSAWVNPKAIDTYRVIISPFDANDSSSQYNIALHIGDGVIEAKRYDGSSSDEVEYSTTSTNEWYHVVGIYDSISSEITLCINGAIIGTISSTLSITNQSNYSIGSQRGGAADFEGRIADLRIYDRALTPQEVQALYQVGKKSEVIFQK